MRVGEDMCVHTSLHRHNPGCLFHYYSPISQTHKHTQGIPSKVRSMVTIYPTVNCLIELTEAPFTVVSMSDVQLVSLERVGFNLRQFDMVCLLWEMVWFC